jgi:hypothetical protein
MCSNRIPQPFQEATDVFVLGIMVKHLVEQAALSSAIDDRQNAEWAIVQLVRSHVAGEIGQSPVEVIRLNPRADFFSPPPRPSFESS